MVIYTVTAPKGRHFELRKDDFLLGSLQYDKWFSFKASLILSDQTVYNIAPKGFWGTTIELKKEDETLLHFKMNWNGNIIIQSNFNEKPRDFIFKNKGMWKHYFQVSDADENELISLEPRFNWKNFEYSYDITTADNFDNFEGKDLYLLTMIHCANYYMSMLSASTAS